MFLTLLAVTFVIALAVSTVVLLILAMPINAILQRIISDEISSAWSRYLTFAIYVTGISSGVKVWQLEKYITPHKYDEQAITLTTERWMLEIYRTMIETL